MNPNSQSHPLRSRGSPLAAGGRAKFSRRTNAARPLRLVASCPLQQHLRAWGAALLATSPTAQGRTKSTTFSMLQKPKNKIHPDKNSIFKARA
jgi:hypothetical protein